MKTCKKCRVEKPLTDFYAHPAMADGHVSSCIDCTLLYAKDYREKNREKARAYGRAYRKKKAREKLASQEDKAS